MLLLGSITSLPEISTSATAALGGNAELAVSNLLGGVAFQVVVLAIADAFVGRKAVTSTVFTPAILVQAVVCILLLALAVAGTVTGDASVLGIGFWSLGMVVTYAVAILFVRGQERHASWIPERGTRANDSKSPEANGGRRPVGARLMIKTAIAGAVILVAGVVLTRTAETIAAQSGLATAFAGMTLLAIATSLPELSTAINSVRLGRNDLAIGDVLGGNMFDLMLIFFVDLLFRGPPVLGEVNRTATFAGLLGIILIAVFLIGMIERRDRTVFRVGYDSLLVLLFYAGGMTLLYRFAS